MRNILTIMGISFGLAAGALAIEPENAGVGEEYIEPLRYPKFSLSADYGMLRKFHGFENNKLRASLPNNMAATLSFEAGLYRYLNAGALLSVNFPLKKVNFEPIHMRLALFAKPYFPITERVSIFGRFGGGLSLSFADYLLIYRTKKDQDEFSEFVRELEKTYSSQEYAPIPFGANFMASIGVEAFPFERIGLALEWGFRGDFFYAKKSSWMSDLKLKPEEKTLNAPSSLKYLVYEMPLMLTVHIIL